jgi:undecaprenyl-diphosphatase
VVRVAAESAICRYQPGTRVSADLSPLQATVYGLVQGLTEFVPVSSSGHLGIVSALDPGFIAVEQPGTVAAVVLFLWRELLHVAAAWCRGVLNSGVRPTLEYRMGWYLILATVPVAVFGLVFADHGHGAGGNLWLIATALIVLGLVLLAADWIGRRNREE